MCVCVAEGGGGGGMYVCTRVGEKKMVFYCSLVPHMHANPAFWHGEEPGYEARFIVHLTSVTSPSPSCTRASVKAMLASVAEVNHL